MAELEATITTDELVGWIAYDELDPFGPERLDIMLGIVGASIVNCWAKDRVKPKDLIPKWGEDPKKGCTRDEFIAWLKARKAQLEKDGAE